MYLLKQNLQLKKHERDRESERERGDEGEGGSEREKRKRERERERERRENTHTHTHTHRNRERGRQREREREREREKRDRDRERGQGEKDWVIMQLTQQKRLLGWTAWGMFVTVLQLSQLFVFCVLFFRLLAAILSETHPDALLSQLIALQDMSESHRLSKVWDGCVALIWNRSYCRSPKWKVKKPERTFFDACQKLVLIQKPRGFWFVVSYTGVWLIATSAFPAQNTPPPPPPQPAVHTFCVVTHWLLTLNAVCVSMVFPFFFSSFSGELRSEIIISDFVDFFCRVWWWKS